MDVRLFAQRPPAGSRFPGGLVVDTPPLPTAAQQTLLLITEYDCALPRDKAEPGARGAVDPIIPPLPRDLMPDGHSDSKFLPYLDV